MIVAFQIMIMIAAILSFLGIMGVQDDPDFREKLVYTYIASLLSFIVITFL